MKIELVSSISLQLVICNDISFVRRIANFKPGMICNDFNGTATVYLFRGVLDAFVNTDFIDEILNIFVQCGTDAILLRAHENRTEDTNEI